MTVPNEHLTHTEKAADRIAATVGNGLDRSEYAFFTNEKTALQEEKMKTQEELNALKNEIETLNKKLADLSEEELEQVTGGLSHGPVHVTD